jgi:cysteinyl-tRNA synthetase
MKIKLYNSLSRKTEEFNSLDEGIVRMYSCGPTVYNYAHIGNMRAFLFADFLQRVLRIVGEYKVKWVMNITNIDDKTIRDSQIGSSAWVPEMGEQTDNPLDNLLKLTKFYEAEFLKDISTLGINPVHFYSMPKATEYIEEMKELILKIKDNGIAYVSDNSVYFNVAKWRNIDKYGKLKNIDFDNFKAGVRVDADQYEREQASDFVLWKAKKDNEPYWDFEIDGVNVPGRPGWHIECSAMEKILLGLPFDIHTGGIDLKFPHHEDEIAQSKAGYGIEPTNFWCHNEFLEVEGQKMSKSLGNFFTLRDLLDKGLDPLDIRFAMLSSHYATNYNFTFDGISSAKKARLRIQDFIYTLFDEKIGTKTLDIESLRDSVFIHLADDLHSPKALASIFNIINNTKSEELDKSSKESLIELFNQLNQIFSAWTLAPKEEEKNEIPENITKLAEERWQAKQDKNWALCDEIRRQILDLGWLIKDTKDGFSVERNPQ